MSHDKKQCQHTLTQLFMEPLMVEDEEVGSKEKGG